MLRGERERESEGDGERERELKSLLKPKKENCTNLKAKNLHNEDGEKKNLKTENNERVTKDQCVDLNSVKGNLIKHKNVAWFNYTMEKKMELNNVRQ